MYVREGEITDPKGSFRYRINNDNVQSYLGAAILAQSLLKQCSCCMQLLKQNSFEGFEGFISYSMLIFSTLTKLKLLTSSFPNARLKQ